MHSSASLEHGGANNGGLSNEKQGYKSRPRNQRGGSWDLLGERAEWEEYKTKDSAVENLRYADGDAGTNKVSLPSR